MLFPFRLSSFISRTAFCVMALTAISSYADQPATADDGRAIVLQQDGKWQYSNNDRFATTADGTRVKLKDDGSWEYIGNAPTKNEQQFRVESLDIKLKQVVTEYTQDKAGNKNVRSKANTVFHLDVDVSSYSASPIAVNLSNFNGLRVSDDRGTTYKIIAVSSGEQVLEPGNNYHFEVRVDGAPKFSTSFLSVKTITLNIDKSVFRTDSDIALTTKTDDISLNKVNSL